jgi:hypothetical protein
MQAPVAIFLQEEGHQVNRHIIQKHHQDIDCNGFFHSAGFRHILLHLLCQKNVFYIGLLPFTNEKEAV